MASPRKRPPSVDEVGAAPRAHAAFEGAGTGEFRVPVKDFMDLVDNRADKECLSKFNGVEGIITALRTNVADGLKQEDCVPEGPRRTFYGANQLPPAPHRSLLSIMLTTIKDKTLIMLMVAAAVSIILGTSIPCPPAPDVCDHDPANGWIEGTAIFVAVFIVVGVTSVNDYSKEAKFRKLNSLKESRDVDVMRSGIRSKVNIYDVVVGDILLLQGGDVLCADGVFINGTNVAVNESSATGESEAVKKGPGNGMVFLSGTEMMDGCFATMVVIAVGVSSYHGRLMMALREKGAKKKAPKEEEAKKNASSSNKVNDSQAEAAPLAISNPEGAKIVVETDTDEKKKDEKKEDEDDDEEGTPLQRKLGQLAERIGLLGLITAGTLFVVLTAKHLITLGVNKQPFDIAILSALVRFLITAITTVVVAVPEGLPLAVTLALAFSMMRMIADKNLVRELAACEVMGGATAICSDKTGTLTQNKMTVVAGTICDIGFDAISEISKVKDGLGAASMDLLLESICCNSTAEEADNPKEPGTRMFTGSRTEVALLKYAEALGAKYATVRDAHPVAAVIPFSSEKKRMSSVVRTGDVYRHHAKGASEVVLAMCERRLSATGEVVNIEPSYRAKCESTISNFAGRCLRTICIAYIESKAPANPEEPDDVTDDLILIGIVGIEDPVRPEVPGAVAQCVKAGIRVRMVTGDNINTARAIAKQCGIFNAEEGGIAMEGPVFRAMKRNDLLAMLPRLQVLARSSPLDKQLLVRSLQELGEVVAVTGDGTNDGPALSMADVGFAMGIAGTEVAKEASSIILMDDNFASIVKAVMWGRNVFDSIRKFLQFQLTVNICAVTIAVIGAISSNKGESPLEPVQLLWVNLIMDTLAALALATDEPTEKLLERKPYGRAPTLITRTMWKHIIGQAAFQLIANLFLLYGSHYFGIAEDSEYQRTLIFNLFVIMQLFNELNCCRIYDEWNPFAGLFKNWIYIIITIATIGVQILFVTFGGKFTSCVPLSIYDWLACFGVSLFAWPLRFFLRLIPMKEPEPQKDVEATASSPSLTSAGPSQTSAHGMQRLGSGGPPGIADPSMNAFRRSAHQLVREAGVVRVLRGGRSNSMSGNPLPTRRSIRSSTTSLVEPIPPNLPGSEEIWEP